MAPLVVFAVVSIGAFHAFTWPPLLAALVLPLLVALIAWRVIMRITAILLGIDRRRDSESGSAIVRLIPMDDVKAAFWYRRVAVFSGIFFTGWAAAGLMTVLNFTPNVKSLIIYILGLGLLAVALETLWRQPEAPVASRAFRVKEWLLTFYLCLLWLLWVAGLSLALVGRNLCAGSAADFEDDQHSREVILCRTLTTQKSPRLPSLRCSLSGEQGWSSLLSPLPGSPWSFASAPAD